MELFAADGHDAGGCERVTGKSGMRPEELRDAERRLDVVNAATGTAREQLVEAATNLSGTERRIERLSRTIEGMVELQKEIDSWVSEASSSSDTGHDVADLDRRTRALTNALRTYLVALGHSAVRTGNVKQVDLDEDYVPHVGARRLRSLGSASDKPRVVAAYCLALAAASRAVGGMHPGFVVLDEPLQQNPDDPHRSLFSEFLSAKLARADGFQTIIFTSLREQEIEILRGRGTAVVTPDGEYFLSSPTRVGGPGGTG